MHKCACALFSIDRVGISPNPEKRATAATMPRLIKTGRRPTIKSNRPLAHLIALADPETYNRLER